MYMQKMKMEGCAVFKNEQKLLQSDVDLSVFYSSFQFTGFHSKVKKNSENWKKADEM